VTFENLMDAVMEDIEESKDLLLNNSSPGKILKGQIPTGPSAVGQLPNDGELHDQRDAKWIVIWGHIDMPFLRPTVGQPRIPKGY
jgi:hypothetical protein